jgi:uncharacterized membrane protein YebE (DUF533 family)
MKYVIAILFVGFIAYSGFSGWQQNYNSPANPKNIEKTKQLIENNPVLKAEFVAAQKDGVVTKGELREINEKIESTN